MKALRLMIMALFFLGGAHPVAALTTDSGKYSNDDGTSKFTDPDENKPAFMNGGADGAPRDPRQPFTLNVTPANPGQQMMPFTGGGHSPGEDAFDHAYAHQGQ
jgi:hypothetical protein